MATTSAGQPPAAELTPTEKFFRYFQQEVTDLQEQMERLKTHGTSGGERADAVDHCLAGISRLSNEVRDASAYTPAYDQRMYSGAIKALSSKLQDVRASLAPRPKFSFKSGPVFTAQKNESAMSLTDAAELAAERQRYYVSNISNNSSFATTPADLQSPASETASEENITQDDAAVASGKVAAPATQQTRHPSSSRITPVNISNHEGVHIILPPSSSSATQATGSGTLSNLHRCVVDMSTPTNTGTGTPFAGLTLKNIRASLVVCGRVDGAAHVTNASNSVLVVASRQFRMHDSRDCHVYLLTSSRPIIEDCRGVRFAPLPQAYMAAAAAGSDDDDDGARAAAAEENQWRNVDDFKWLRNEPSPNWSVLEPADRVPAEVWRDVVPGGAGLGTEDVLKAVGLPG